MLSVLKIPLSNIKLSSNNMDQRKMQKEVKNKMTRRKAKRVIDGDTFELHQELQGTKIVRIAN